MPLERSAESRGYTLGNDEFTKEEIKDTKSGGASETVSEAKDETKAATKPGSESEEKPVKKTAKTTKKAEESLEEPNETKAGKKPKGKNKEKTEDKESSKVRTVKERIKQGGRFFQKTASMIKEATEQFRLDAEYENPDRPEDVRYDDIVTPIAKLNEEYKAAEEEENPEKVKENTEKVENEGEKGQGEKSKHKYSADVKDIVIVLRILANLALTIVALILAIIFIPRLFKFFLPFIIAGVLAAIATPLVKLIRKKLKLTQKLGSAIVIILVIAAVVGALYGILYFLIAQINNLINDREAIVDSVRTAMKRMGDSMSGLYAIMPSSIQKFISGTSEDVIQVVQEFTETLKLPTLSDASSFLNAGVDVVFSVIICFIAAYFFTSQQAEIASWFQTHTPESTMSYFKLIKDNFKKAIGGYFKAQFKIMLIMFVIMFIWFEIMDINYSALVAFGVAFLDFLPVLGMGAVLWPWIIVDIIGANYTEAILLGVLYGICQLIRQVLQPKLVSDAVEMNPLLTLFFMYVGYKINGIWGLIIGIPVGMVLVSLIRIGAFDRLTKGIKIIVKIVNDFRKY